MTGSSLLILTSAEQAAIVITLHRSDLSLRQRERLEMVKGAALGWELAAIAAWAGRQETTVQRWLAAYQTSGIDALVDAPRSGRPCLADTTYLVALETAVTTAPRDLGLPFDAWTSGRLSAYLAETTGVRIAPGWLRVLLHQHGFAHGRPKHSVAHLQDPDEVAACQEQLRVVGGKGGR